MPDEHRILGYPTALGEHDVQGRALIGLLLDEIRPDTILTFGPDGRTFHPDHITVHRWVTDAWQQRGRRSRLLYAPRPPSSTLRASPSFPNSGTST